MEPLGSTNPFADKLATETDPADLRDLLRRGASGVVVVDARSRADFETAHIPGALSLPWAAITPGTTAVIPPGARVVTYCWGPACNAATKAAARLVDLGFADVREMIGGIEYWRREGGPVAGTGEGPVAGTGEAPVAGTGERSDRPGGAGAQAGVGASDSGK